MTKENTPKEIIHLQVCAMLNHPVSPQIYFEIREKFPNYFLGENKTPFWKDVSELEDELYKSALEENSSDDFILSAVIGATTNSAVLGGLLGGSIIGGVVGDLFD